MPPATRGSAAPAMNLEQASAALSVVGPALATALDDPQVQGVFDALAARNGLCLHETTWGSGFKPSTYLSQSGEAGQAQHVIIPARTLLNMGMLARHIDNVRAQGDGWLTQNAVHAEIPRGFLLALCEAAGRSDRTSADIRDSRMTALMRRQAQSSQPLTKLELDAKCSITAHQLVYTMCSIADLQLRIQMRPVKGPGGAVLCYDFAFKLKSAHSLAPHPWVEYFDQSAAAADGLGERRTGVTTVSIPQIDQVVGHLAGISVNAMVEQARNDEGAAAVLQALLDPARAHNVTTAEQLMPLAGTVPNLLQPRTTATAGAAPAHTAVDAVAHIVALNERIAQGNVG